MYKYLKFSILLIFIGCQFSVFSQNCAEGEIYLNIKFLTDNYGYEFSWELVTLDGTIIHASPEDEQYGNDTLYDLEYCLSENTCYQLRLNDTYGDGFLDQGFIDVIIDSDTVAQLKDYDYFYSIDFNCPEGSVCSSAVPLEDGVSQQVNEESWYTIELETPGLYEISTCNNPEGCSSTIWIYETCDGEITDSNEGTIFYNTESDSCGGLATIFAPLTIDKEYYVRIKYEGACEGLEINFNYQGTILGCTDPASCNYDPLAIEDDGSCFSWEDPRCEDGPDLRLNPDVLRSSLFLDQLENNDGCLIEENCIKGYGIRDIIRFSTQIENVGSLDYFIGDPVDAPGQFEYDPCHNHWHYDGYAKYTLYDSEGNLIPIGYKNGFCVLDLVCPSFDMYTYGCDYMGISAGCVDIYDSNLDCQWLDITDVPDGDYLFLARVNEDLARDALGRPEMDSLNNNAQLCFNLSRTSGVAAIELIDECDLYIDCAGTLYGSAEVDCHGNCAGTALAGDANQDLLISAADVQMYIVNIFDKMPTTRCNDLHEDGELNIYDAALLKSCIFYGQNHEHDGGSTVHDHCTFPTGIYNDVQPFAIKLDHPENKSYVDVNIMNASDGLYSFQFQLSGIEIESVVEMNDSPDQIFDIYFDQESGTVMGLATANIGLPRSDEFQSVVRVHFNTHDGEVCFLDNSIFSSDSDELILTIIEESCISIVISNTNEIIESNQIIITPNPASDFVNIEIENISDFSQYVVRQVDGKLLDSSNKIEQKFSLDVSEWQDGIYFITISGSAKSVVKKIIVQGSNQED